jgi:4-hydroxybenzoate polyprenyltransferase
MTCLIIFTLKKFNSGLKSTALYLGESPQIPLSLMAGGMISGLLITGYTGGLSTPYYLLIGGAGSHLLWQIWSADLNDASNLWYRFDSNKYIGGVIAAAIVGGKVF